MKALVIVLGVLVLILIGVSGYLYFKQIPALKEALAQSEEKNQELGYEVQQLQSKNDQLSREIERKVSEVSKAKEEEIAAVKATYDQLLADMKEEIEKGEIQVTQLAGQLKVDIVDRILFPSGEADLTPQGLKVLERVAKILKEAQDKIIRVEGHTDNVPIKPTLQKKFPTNWELSTARATTVVRFLQEKVGIEPTRLEAAGFSEYRPVATNATEKGRAKNRRIEITLLAKR